MPEDVSPVVPTLSTPQTPATARRSVPGLGERQTPFGGAFLLLPLIADLPVDVVTAGWPACGDVPASTLVRFLLLAHCLGGACTSRLFLDAVIRDSLQMNVRVRLPDVAEWLRHLTSRQAKQLESGAVTWLRAAGAVTGHALVLARARDGERGVMVLVDCARGHWLLVRPSRAARLPVLFGDLRPWLAWAEECNGVVLVQGSPTLTDAIHAAYPRLGVIPTQVHTSDAPPADVDLITATYARLPQLREELQYLAPPSLFRERPTVRHAFHLAAHAVLRRFAWRLPGFARASLPHLFTNFLDVSASGDEHPARRVIR